MTAPLFPPRPRLRLVPPEPAPRHRLAVRISVLDGHSAFGRSRVFRLAHNELDELIAVAMRMGVAPEPERSAHDGGPATLLGVALDKLGEAAR
jgi:hypothetical protein